MATWRWPAPRTGGGATATPHLNCDYEKQLPAIPPATTALRAGDKPDQPEHEDRDSDPPENLDRKTRTGKNQNQQKNKKQGNHIYQPPRRHLPDHAPAMRRKPTCFSSAQAGIRLGPVRLPFSPHGRGRRTACSSTDRFVRLPTPPARSRAERRGAPHDRPASQRPTVLRRLAASAALAPSPPPDGGPCRRFTPRTA